MTKDEALKLALEALKQIDEAMPFPVAKLAQASIKEALAQPERDYERGFIDGMQKQMQSSVDKAVNAMTQRTWVGCAECGVNGNHALYCVKCAEKYLKEKNIR